MESLFSLGFFPDNDDTYFDDDSFAKDNLCSEKDQFKNNFEYSELDENGEPIENYDFEEDISMDHVIGVGGAILDELENTSINDDNENQVEYVSMKQAMNISKRHNVNGRPQIPLRPFEQFINDVISGKKSLKDD